MYNNTPHNHNMLRIKWRYSRNKYVFVFCVCVKLTKSTHLMFLCPVHGTLLPVLYMAPCYPTYRTAAAAAVLSQVWE